MMKDMQQHEREEARTVELLERLGAAERSGPDGGFEARIAAGAMAQAEDPIAFPSPAERAWWKSAPVRVAAALALIVGAWFAVDRSLRAPVSAAGRGAIASHEQRSEVLSDEEWFETYTLVTAALDGGAGDAIDELVSDTAELGARVKGAGSVESLLGDTL